MPPEMERIKISILALLASIFFSNSLACGYVPAQELRRVERWARSAGIDPLLLAAVVWTESRFCPQAVGQAGEVGLGQLMPGTFRAVTGKPPSWRADPDWNLWAAAQHLRTLYLRFGDWPRAILAYNAGAGAVMRGEVPASSYAYMRRVLFTYTYWRQRR